VKENNENRRNSDKRSGSKSPRDGKPYEKKFRTRISKPSEEKDFGFSKERKRPESSAGFGNKPSFRSPSSSENTRGPRTFSDAKPFRKDDGRSPRFDSNTSSNDKRKPFRTSEGGGSRSYDKPSFGGDRPARRNTESGGAYGDKPTFRSSDKPSFGGDRPARRNAESGGAYGGKPTFRSSDKPSFGGDRPPRANAESGERFGDKKFSKPFKRPESGAYGDKPTFRSSDKPSFGGDRPARRNTESGGAYGGKPSFRSADRPSFGGDRPPRANAESGERFGDKKFNRPFKSSDKPSFRTSDKPSFDKRPSSQKDSEFSETFEDKKFGKPVKRNDPTYDPNAKYSLKKQIEHKKMSLNANDPIRLNRYLANSGICSRREADDYIRAGVITVNGQIITELGTKVTVADKVMFHDQTVRSERKVYILMNKPKDCVTTSDDPQERFTVMDLIKDACRERVYPVGRLDRNTTGVLLLTNDGDLAARLTHPKYNKKKIYHVHLDKALTKNDMESIANGIKLDDGEIHADQITYVEENDKKQVGVEIHSGRNRIVRRIFEHLGYKVEKLDRVYFAGLTKKNLSRGKFRFLSEREVNMLNMGAFE
jgi:23S rRNA pseudouridine2605 synthase